MNSNTKNSFYKNKKVCVTGGAGFIGSNIVRNLIDLGAKVTIVDNLSTGLLTNIKRIFKDKNIEFSSYKNKKISTNKGHKFIFADCLNLCDIISIIKGQNIVFHLACNFGGRGYIDTHPADCSTNFAINTNVFHASYLAKVERVAFASSACVYPLDLQKGYNSKYLLKEKDAFNNNWANADQEYGWAKLMGELTLKAYYKQYGLKSSITRYVTAYGPGENDTHAIIALIKRAIEKKDPYIVWGTGEQDRDFTYLDDIVSGTLLACEKIKDATVVNLGTSKRYKIKDVVEMIFNATNFYPKKIIFDKTKPEGVPTRALDNGLAKKIIGWSPKYDLDKGIQLTVDWFKKANPKSIETIR